MRVDGYRAAIDAAAYRVRSDRRRLLVSGPDRVRFLHNLTTNDVKRLAPGQGCESFVTSPQGKTLAYVQLQALPEQILLRTESPGFDSLKAHLAKYGLFDEVQIDDISGSSMELHLVGPAAEDCLTRLGLPRPSSPGSHAEGSIAGRPALVVCESPTGRPGWTIIAEPEATNALIEGLRGSRPGAEPVELDEPTWEALRIEGGTPLSGRDVTPENLPQEVGRDAQAISFVKGCYLGQETVARIDALGHVNKLLRGLTIAGESIPESACELKEGDKVVGRLTSWAFSPGWGCIVGLAYMRTTHTEPERVLSLGSTTGTVRALPMIPAP